MNTFIIGENNYGRLAGLLKFLWLGTLGGLFKISLISSDLFFCEVRGMSKVYNAHVEYPFTKAKVFINVSSDSGTFDF